MLKPSSIVTGLLSVIIMFGVGGVKPTAAFSVGYGFSNCVAGPLECSPLDDPSKRDVFEVEVERVGQTEAKPDPILDGIQPSIPGQPPLKLTIVSGSSSIGNGSLRAGAVGFMSMALDDPRRPQGAAAKAKVWISDVLHITAAPGSYQEGLSATIIIDVQGSLKRDIRSRYAIAEGELNASFGGEIQEKHWTVTGTFVSDVSIDESVTLEKTLLAPGETLIETLTFDEAVTIELWTSAWTSASNNFVVAEFPESAVFRLGALPDGVSYTSDSGVFPVLRPIYCDGDHDEDSDVDGRDLNTQIAGDTGVSLEDFAANFGKPDCSQTT